MSVFRNGLFAGKVALVTGGGTGIGKAITTELLTLGTKYIFFISLKFLYLLYFNYFEQGVKLLLQVAVLIS